jgi:hypothetical protein
MVMTVLVEHLSLRPQINRTRGFRKAPNMESFNDGLYSFSN